MSPWRPFRFSDCIPLGQFTFPHNHIHFREAKNITAFSKRALVQTSREITSILCVIVLCVVSFLVSGSNIYAVKPLIYVGDKLVDQSDVRCSNYIFILDLTPGFNGLIKDNCRSRRKSFEFWDLVWLIKEVLWYLSTVYNLHCSAMLYWLAGFHNSLSPWRF